MAAPSSIVPVMASKTKTKKKHFVAQKVKLFRASDPLLSVLMWGVNHSVSAAVRPTQARPPRWGIAPGGCGGTGGTGAGACRWEPPRRLSPLARRGRERGTERGECGAERLPCPARVRVMCGGRAGCLRLPVSALSPCGSARRQRAGGAREGTVLRAEPEQLRSCGRPRAGVLWMCCSWGKSRLSVGTGQVRSVSVQFASASVRCRCARGRGRGRA